MSSDTVSGFTPGLWSVAPMTPTRIDTQDGSISISWGGNGEIAKARELRAEANARLIASSPDLLSIAVRASETDGTLLGQAATWIGGVVDGYNMTGANKESGERLYKLLHDLDADARAAIAKAKGAVAPNTKS